MHTIAVDPVTAALLTTRRQQDHTRDDPTYKEWRDE